MLCLLCLFALFGPQSPAPSATLKIDSGDTAWMLPSTCLVLLMTPGLSFFMGECSRPVSWRAKSGCSSVRQTMLAHLLALVVVGSSAFGVSWSLYWMTDRLITLRVAAEEAIGLDISQHVEFLELDPVRQSGGVIH